jgi:molecular chaperone GrpE
MNDQPTPSDLPTPESPQPPSPTPDPSLAPPPETEPAGVKTNELEQLREENRQAKEAHLRALADLQNVRRRAQEERIRLPQLGAQSLLTALLPTLDHLELALKNKPAQDSDWTRGVEAIFHSFWGALAAEGVERITATGVAVDPAIHEVITAENGGDTVVEVFQAGYRLGDRIVRPAKVKAGPAADAG